MKKKYQQKAMERLQEIINSQQQEIERLSQLIQVYENSSSWKITAPLREAGQVIRKAKRVIRKKQAGSIDSMNQVPGTLTEDNGMELPASEAEKNNSPEREYINYIMSIPQQGADGDEYVEKSKDVSISLTEEDVKYLAFYLPQFHAFPENDAWWGKNFTEWTNVTKAVPQFTGHYQPRLAGDLGYYSLKNKETIRDQMELAKLYGVYGFCIYYYWFDGKKLMETPLELILQNPELDLPFCICWANENWSRRWDGKETDILIAQNYTEDFPEAFMKDVIVYMEDSRYIRINGKPLLVIYNANDIPELSNVLERWRKYCRSNSLGEIHIAAVDFSLNAVSKEAGFDSFVEFPPHSTYYYPKTLLNDQLEIMNGQYTGTIYDYQEIVNRKDYLGTAREKMFPGIFLGWDNTARKRNASTIYHNFSPEAFAEWLLDITNYTKAVRPVGERFAFINAWNEWAEGTYLEPDRRYGYAALEAVKNTVLASRDKKRIIYVSHDAWFNGAQMLSVNIVRSLHEVYGYDVYLILKETGVLREEFEGVAKEVVCPEEKEWTDTELKNWIYATGAENALCNTVVAGDITEVLHQSGVRVISLIHEMEKVIIDNHCQENLQKIAKYADKVVYASDYVRRSGDKVFRMPEEKIVIKPQGMYKRNQYLEKRLEIKKQIYNKYHIDENQKLVIGVGFGDYRKGVDLFIKSALENIRKNQDITYMWVGELNPEMELLRNQILTEADTRNKILFAGKQEDPMPYYTAADIFLLTSREDPFPTVVMEAMYAYLPVIAFENGGGYVEIVNESTGKLVPMEDYKAMAENVERFSKNEDLLKQVGEYAHRFVAERFQFHVYVGELLELLGEKVPKVSVVIPNYNYERYLAKRIDSVLFQDYPIKEIVLLDDCSTDDSINIMKTYEQKYPKLIRLYENKENSGNVFCQWRKGLELVTGDYVWIAEADDLAHSQFLPCVMGKMNSNADMVMCYAQSKMMDEHGNITADNYFCYTDDIDPVAWKEDYCVDCQQELREHMSVKNVIPNVSGVIFKNRDFSDILANAMQYSVAGDWRVYVDIMAKGGQVGFVAESLNYHRRHSNSVTTDLKAEKHYQEVCQMQDYIEGITGTKNDKKEAYREYLQKYLAL